MNKECIYIAGPECFYRGGDQILEAMRRRAESFGCEVSLPNDHKFVWDQDNLTKNADAIFMNCANSLNRSTAIICDLEFFRGPEVDGGSVYEIGMAYARGIRCYGYTRDKRPMIWKYYGWELRDGVIYDRKGRILPYQDLPFSPNVIGSTKIIQGDFNVCLDAMLTDIEEERKLSVLRDRTIPDVAKEEMSLPKSRKPIAYLSGSERYEADDIIRYECMKKLCNRYGFDAITPVDDAAGIQRIHSDDPYVRAYNIFDHNQRHVRNCDLIIANLNMFHAWEPESDTSFECGMAYQLGKKLYAYMDDTRIMRERIPNYGSVNGFRDVCGCNVENFNYPINLMFASSMKIFEGTFDSIISKVAEDYFG